MKAILDTVAMAAPGKAPAAGAVARAVSIRTAVAVVSPDLPVRPAVRIRSSAAAAVGRGEDEEAVV